MVEGKLSLWDELLLLTGGILDGNRLAIEMEIWSELEVAI